MTPTRKYFFFLPFLIVFTISKAQGVDATINKSSYLSYYSYNIKSPLYVVYYLFKGGGNCSREKLRFRSEQKSATDEDYKKSGYERGHLVNAEDFAYDCEKERQTFSYYNCVAQSRELNRGSWKSWETAIRKESQKDSLKIYAGAIYGSEVIGSGVRVPEYCWKVVYNTRTKLVLHALIFTNNKTPQVMRTTISQLKSMLKYDVNFSAE
jgi:endonuclease G